MSLGIHKHVNQRPRTFSNTSHSLEEVPVVHWPRRDFPRVHTVLLLTAEEYVPQTSLVCVSISQQVRTPPQRDESLGRTSALEKVRVIAGQSVMWRWRMCGELVTASHWETPRLFSLVAEWSLGRYFNSKWTAEKSWLVINNVIRCIKELLCCLVVKHI